MQTALMAIGRLLLDHPGTEIKIQSSRIQPIVTFDITLPGCKTREFATHLQTWVDDDQQTLIVCIDQLEHEWRTMKDDIRRASKPTP
jgi:hypothetical protein